MLRLACVIAVLAFRVAANTSQAEDLSECLDAEELHAAGDLHAAIEHYDRCLRDGDLSMALRALTRLNRGLAYHSLADLERAIDDYSVAISLDPTLVPAYVERGGAFSAKGWHNRAIEDYDAAIAIDPSTGRAFTGRANAWYQMKQFHRAFEDADKAIQLAPADAWSYALRGDIRRDLGYPEEAIADYGEAIRLNPEDVHPYTARGWVRALLGRYGDAEKDYSAALRLAPSDATAMSGLARLLATSPDVDHRDGARAVTLALAAVEQQPDSVAFVDALAASFAEAGRFQEAVEAQQRAIALARRQGWPHIVPFMETRLAAYQLLMPWREPPLRP
jgi:tetratricopeptide (TPR) repeat protein